MANLNLKFRLFFQHYLNYNKDLEKKRFFSKRPLLSFFSCVIYLLKQNKYKTKKGVFIMKKRKLSITKGFYDVMKESR